MPTLIYYDQSGHTAAQREAAQQAQRFTDLIAQYVALNMAGAAPIATADLPGLIEDPTAWLVARLMGNNPFMLNGLPIKYDKVLELIERPAGFDAFIKAAAEQVNWLRHLRGVLRSAESYAVGVGGVVSLSAAAAQQLENSFKSYTATAAQDALLTELNSFSTLLNGLRTKYGQGHTLSSLLEKVLVAPQDFGNSPTNVRPNPAFIQQFAR